MGWLQRHSKVIVVSGIIFLVVSLGAGSLFATNLGQRTETWTVRDVKPLQLPKIDPAPDYVRPTTRNVLGLDVFVESPLAAAELGKQGGKVLDRVCEHHSDAGWPGLPSHPPLSSESLSRGSVARRTHGAT